MPKIYIFLRVWSLFSFLAINGRVNQFAILNVNALYSRIKERKGKRDTTNAVKGEKHEEEEEEIREGRADGE